MQQGYEWLWNEPGPRILREARYLYGTYELPGEANNQLIIEWAKEVGGWIGSWYQEDSVPWCGLFMAVIAKRARFPFDQKALSALAWADWGEYSPIPMLGDVMVFKRTGGGHVGLYVGEDHEAYHILGGNQSDMVNVTRINKHRFYAARRCPWRYAQPDNVRVVNLSAYGKISENEA